ncbi:hypothetical protein DRP77_02660 [Candidatus Poribacteria bacterium]|nr:MAG: hypothetical protein DRP77_02660 [Candidatus Poribacteria bacterium]
MFGIGGRGMGARWRWRRGWRGGRGREGGRGPAPGQEEFCICPACGTRIPHERGVPCSTVQCPNCGARMVRER